MVQIDPVKDLAALFNRPEDERYSGLRYAQGTIISWNPTNFTNKVGLRTLTLTNLPILGKIDGLSLKAGDVVGLMGWAPNGGFGSWWILGELGTPPLAEPVAVEGGANFNVNDGGNVNVNDGGSVIVSANGEVLIDGISQSTVLRDGGLEFRDSVEEVGSLEFISNTVFLNVASSLRILYSEDSGGLALARTTGGGGATFTHSFRVGATVLDHSTVGTGTPNVDMLANGLVQRITSSQRYKTDIQDFVTNPRTILDLKPRAWRDKATVERDPDDQHWGVGFIAEELDEVGLGAFVRYDHEGRPDSIAYDRLTVPLLVLCKDQQRRLDDLESRVHALDGRASPEADHGQVTRVPKWRDVEPQTNISAVPPKYQKRHFGSVDSPGTT